MNVFSHPRMENEFTPSGFCDSWVVRVNSAQSEGLTIPIRVFLVAFHSGAIDFTDKSSAREVDLPSQLKHSTIHRQAEFLFGRLAARYALTHISPKFSDIFVPIGEHREPVWPEGVLGSITHVSGLAAAAVVPDTSLRFLGIDLEEPASGIAQRALRRLVIDNAELSLLQSVLQSIPLDRHITHVFSAKECLFKAAFPTVRCFFGFSEARLCSYEVLPQGCGPEIRLALEMVRGVGGEFVAGSRWWVEIWRLPNSEFFLSVLAC